MFTGLVEAMGDVLSNDLQTDGVTRRLGIRAPFAEHLTLGESVAINGICLTVVEQDAESFYADVSPTTRKLSTVDLWQPRDMVNLERSVTPETRLGGHWVLGHVDTTGSIQKIVRAGQSRHLTIAYPERFRSGILALGSITVNGVSLTLVDCTDDVFRVTIIPHTWRMTGFQYATIGQKVNLEFDVLGKYVAHLMAPYLNYASEGGSRS